MIDWLVYWFVYGCSYVKCLGDRGHVLTCGLLATIIQAQSLPCYQTAVMLAHSEHHNKMTTMCECSVELLDDSAIDLQSHVAVNISCGQEPPLWRVSARLKYGVSMVATVEPIMRDCLVYGFVYSCSHVNCFGDRGYILTCGLLAPIIQALFSLHCHQIAVTAGDWG